MSKSSRSPGVSAASSLGKSSIPDTPGPPGLITNDPIRFAGTSARCRSTAIPMVGPPGHAVVEWDRQGPALEVAATCDPRDRPDRRVGDGRGRRGRRGRRRLRGGRRVEGTSCTVARPSRTSARGKEQRNAEPGGQKSKGGRTPETHRHGVTGIHRTKSATVPAAPRVALVPAGAPRRPGSPRTTSRHSGAGGLAGRVDAMRLGVTAFLTDRDMAPAALARAAEERGFDSLYLPEHTHLPLRADVPPGTRRRCADRGLSPGAVPSRRPLDCGGDHRANRPRDGDPSGRPARSHRPGQAGRHPRPSLRWPFHLGHRLRMEPGGSGGPQSGLRAPARHRPRVHLVHASALVAGTSRVPRRIRRPSPGLGVAQTRATARVRVLIGGGSGDAVLRAVAEYADGWMPIGGSGLADVIPRLHRLHGGGGIRPKSP